MKVFAQMYCDEGEFYSLEEDIASVENPRTYVDDFDASAMIEVTPGFMEEYHTVLDRYWAMNSKIMELITEEVKKNKKRKKK